jgi:hypothetical protein
LLNNKLIMSFSKLCPDLFNLVCEKLSNKDLYTLYQLNKEIRGKIQKFIERKTINSIYAKLEELFNSEMTSQKSHPETISQKSQSKENVENFLKALKESHAVISGSFILQNILNESYENSNLDIYVNSRYFDLSQGNMIVEGFQRNKVQTPLDEFLEKILPQEGVGKLKIYQAIEYQSCGPNIEFVRRYYNDTQTKIIQLIFVNTDNISDYILKYFDFEICKNIFDGKILYIDNLESILSYTFTFPPPEYFENKEISKNLNNGNINEILINTIYRSLKYVKRNFRLKIMKNIEVEKYLTLYNGRVYCHVSQQCRNSCIVKLLYPNIEHVHVQKEEYKYIDYIEITEK